MGWRDEGAASPPEKCLSGQCLCRPACAAQMARAEAFLASLRVPRAPSLQLVEPVRGHVWLCAACRTPQPGSGSHCGYRIILVESKGLVQDATGHVIKATAAQPMAYFRVPTKGGP